MRIIEKNMEKSMETTIAYWGYMGIMDKKSERTFYCNFSVAIRRCLQTRTRVG